MDLKPELIHVEIPRSALCLFETWRTNRPEGHVPGVTPDRPGRPARCKHCHRRLEWDSRYHTHVSFYRIKEEEQPWL